APRSRASAGRRLRRYETTRFPPRSRVYSWFVSFSAAPGHPATRIGDHGVHAFQLLRIDLLAAEEAQDQLIRGAVEDAIEKPGRAFVPAIARRGNERAALDMVGDEAFLLLHEAEKRLHGVVGEVLVGPARQVAIDSADAGRPVLPEHFEDLHLSFGRCRQIRHGESPGNRNRKA